MKTLSNYDILIIVSNRLYLVLVIRFTYKIWGIDTYLPREGTETFGLRIRKQNTVLVYRYLSTSRGDGNLNEAYLTMFVKMCIDTYLPREGTETLKFFHFFFKHILYRYLSTSRGDGNNV